MAFPHPALGHAGGLTKTYQPLSEYVKRPEWINHGSDKEFTMPIKTRHYRSPEDYQLVDHFLSEHYQPGNQDGNWIEPAWEYMHGHPFLDSSALGKIGIWEDDGKIVAIAHYESQLGEAFFQFHPGYKHLIQEMLDYAEGNLHSVSNKDGRKFLRAYVNDSEVEFLSLVMAQGYTRDAKGDRPMARFVIPDSFPPICLPEGFRLKSLAEDCNWSKVNRVLWRGFNHVGEPPTGDGQLEERKKMFDTPTAGVAYTPPDAGNEYDETVLDEGL